MFYEHKCTTKVDLFYACENNLLSNRPSTLPCTYTILFLRLYTDGKYLVLFTHSYHLINYIHIDATITTNWFYSWIICLLCIANHVQKTTTKLQAKLRDLSPFTTMSPTANTLKTAEKMLLTFKTILILLEYYNSRLNVYLTLSFNIFFTGLVSTGSTNVNMHYISKLQWMLSAMNLFL